MPVKRLRNKKLMAPKGRSATAHFVLRMDWQVKLLNDVGLRFAINWSKLQELGLLDGVKTGKMCEAALGLLGAQPVPKTLFWCTDQEQTQLTGGEFILSVLRVTGGRFEDWFHRCSNDLATAQAEAGLTVMYYSAVLIYNIGYGPWQSCLWWQTMLAQAAALKNVLTSDSPIVLRLWKRRIRELGLQGETSPELIGKEARVAWLESIDAKAVMNLKMHKVKTSTWMSLQMAHESGWGAHGTSRTTILSNMCMNKGWISTAEDLFAGAGMRSFRTEAENGSGPLPKSKAEALRSAKKKVDALKSRAKQTVAAATIAAADDDVINGINLIAHGSDAEFREFQRTASTLKSPDDTAAFSQSWSQWGWLVVCKKTLLCRNDAAGLALCGYQTAFATHEVGDLLITSPEVKYQDCLARTLGLFTDRIISNRIGSMIGWTTMYPKRLAGLLCESTRPRALAQFQKACKAFWKSKDMDNTILPLFISFLSLLCFRMVCTFTFKHVLPRPPPFHIADSRGGGHVRGRWCCGCVRTHSRRRRFSAPSQTRAATEAKVVCLAQADV